MAKPGVITMSMRELDRLKTIQAVIDGRLPQTLAAERLGMSDRQVRRLLQRYAIDGPLGLISKLRGRSSNRQLAFGRAELAMTLIKEHYADFGPTLAREKLEERHGLHLAKETVRSLMIAMGLWVPRKQRPPKIHQSRSRRQCAGELIQIDGSDHRWFEERAPACTILVYVDDATSRIMELLFTESESTFSYFQRRLHGRRRGRADPTGILI